MELLPELAVRPGYVPPGDLPQGTCTWTPLPGGRIRVGHADPRILVSAELLAEVFIHPAEGISVGQPSDSENGTPFWTGAVLRISGVNRQVIYRITGYVPAVHGYIGEWPD